MGALIELEIYVKHDKQGEGPGGACNIRGESENG